MIHLKKLLVFAEIVGGILLIYFGLTAFTPFVVNIALVVSGFLAFSDGLGKLDKINGNGQNPNQA